MYTITNAEGVVLAVANSKEELEQKRSEVLALIEE